MHGNCSSQIRTYVPIRCGSAVACADALGPEWSELATAHAATDDVEVASRGKSQLMLHGECGAMIETYGISNIDILAFCISGYVYFWNMLQYNRVIMYYIVYNEAK